MRTQLVRAALLTAGGLAILVGWVVLGQRAADGLRGGDRYTIAFADVDCVPPPRFSRADFLAEVQYLSNLPDRLAVTDDNLAGRLASAFAAHPLVESVERVEVLPRRIEVALNYRVPALAIPVGDKLRVVDGKGVLLPLTVVAERLPLLDGVTVAAPVGPAGTRWSDNRIAGAAQLAAYLRRSAAAALVEKIRGDGEEYLLIVRGARLRWGRPPGQEARGEPSAPVKVARLREFGERHEPPGDREIDLTQTGKEQPLAPP